jgi:hypothetical protein
MRASEAGITSRLDRGQVKKAKRARRAHLRRPEVILHALFVAARKRWPITMSMSSDVAAHMRRKRLVAAFDHFEAAQRFKRPARGRRKLLTKTNGGSRPIVSFHWISRAQQIALKSSFTPFADLHEGQFMLSRDPGRRGPAAVRKALLATLRECSDDSVFMQFDVRDFFGSISHEWLEGNLGIDPAIVRRQIHTAEMLIVPIGETMVVRGPHEASTTEKVRRGIPQGSALSSLIAEMVMAAVARGVAVFGELPVFIWSDNVGVIVPRHRAREVETLVRSAFAEHGAGPFQLTVSATPVVREFKFLGSWYRKTAVGAEAYVPAPVANAWSLKVGDWITVASMTELAAIERHVRDKLAQWRWWTGADHLEADMLRLIDSARSGLRVRAALKGACRNPLQPVATAAI